MSSAGFSQLDRSERRRHISLAMRLAAWMEKHEVSPGEFAGRIGVHIATVYRLIGGDVIPKRGNLMAILRETGGEVSADDLVAAAKEREPEEV